MLHTGARRPHRVGWVGVWRCWCVSWAWLGRWPAQRPAQPPTGGPLMNGAQILPPTVFIVGAVLAFLVAAIVQIAFCISVYSNARRAHRDGILLFVTPLIWLLATLLGGVFVAAIFWVMHYSTLRSGVTASPTTPQ